MDQISSVAQPHYMQDNSAIQPELSMHPNESTEAGMGSLAEKLECWQIWKINNFIPSDGNIPEEPPLSPLGVKFDNV